MAFFVSFRVTLHFVTLYYDFYVLIGTLFIYPLHFFPTSVYESISQCKAMNFFRILHPSYFRRGYLTSTKLRQSSENHTLLEWCVCFELHLDVSFIQVRRKLHVTVSSSIGTAETSRCDVNS